MKTTEALQLGMLVGVAYLLAKLVQAGTNVADKATSAIADWWLKTHPLPPAIQLLGYVTFPGNIKVAVDALRKANAIRYTPDPDFHVYVDYAGYKWELGPQTNGFYPATRVT